MNVGPYYLSPAAREALRLANEARRADLEARRLLRATAQRLDIDLRLPAVDRRSANDRRQGAERRGAVTVLDDDGRVVIQPRRDIDFGERAPDVSAFIIDNEHRHG